MSNPNAAQAPVTVIGLGLMGQALAGAFLKNGHPTTVWNRTPEKGDDLVSQGVTRAESVEDAITSGPLVVVCISDYDAVHALLDPLADALAGRVMVNLCTGTSEEARQTATWAADRNIVYLEGVIMAIPPDIATENAVLLYSGPQPVYGTHESTLQAVAPEGTIYLGEDHGLSPIYDMAILNFLWGVLNAFLQGAALLETANVKAAEFAPLAIRMVNVTPAYIDAYAPQVDAGTYPGDDATMNVHQAGIAHLVEESEHLGVNAEIPRLFKALADRSVADGHGDSSYAAMIEQFRKPG